MARRLEFSGITSGETVIGAGVVVTGNLTSDSDITIDGKLTGEIKAAGNVNIGINGQIKADVTADNISVAGQLKGNIMANGETSIANSGRVQGNIITGLLQIASGAIFIGRSTMAKPELAPEMDAPNPEET
jgi:cytoskeletal protein CcmA (bactofilin family)